MGFSAKIIQGNSTLKGRPGFSYPSQRYGQKDEQRQERGSLPEGPDQVLTPLSLLHSLTSWGGVAVEKD